jgi:hypothetical protein
MKPIPMALGIALSLGSGSPGAADPEPVRAQTVGDLLESGGKQLDGAAFRAAFVGKTMKGTTAAGAQWEGSFDADGTHNGTSYNAIGGHMWSRGKVMAFYGPYQVADDGKVCYQLRWSPGTGQLNACIVAFEWRGEHYIAPNAEPGTFVFKRSP